MKRKTIKLLFAFIMTLALLVLFISVGLGIGVFNSRSIIKSIDQSDYYNKVYNSIYQKTQILLSEGGLSVDLLSDVITPARVHADGINYVNATLNDKSPYISDIYNDLVSHISNNQSLEADNSSTNIDIDDIATGIEYEYSNEVELVFVKYLMNIKAGFKKVMIILIPCILLLLIILSYLLIRMDRYKHRGIRYIAYAMIASSVLTVLTAAYCLLSRSYIDSSIVPDYYNQFISSYLKNGITVYIYIGILGFIVALGLITLIGHMRNKIVYTNK